MQHIILSIFFKEKQIFITSVLNVHTMRSFFESKTAKNENFRGTSSVHSEPYTKYIHTKGKQMTSLQNQ